MSLTRAILLVLIGAVAAPVIVQQFTSPTTAHSPAEGETPEPPKVDESALRFFASRGDSQRLEAEIARLRALYPGWQPPQDLFSLTPDQDPDVARMWQLYSEGKFSDIRAAIAQRQATSPDWKPPAELLTRLDEGEAARRLVNASEAKQWGTVLRIATDTPGMLVCANMDVLWRVAEAFVRTNAANRAQDLYTYILTNCPDPKERVATLQKALQLLDAADFDALLASQGANLENTPEFENLRADLLRTKVGHAAGSAAATVSADELSALQQLARSGSGAGDALVLGWYDLRHDNAAGALDWFKLALDRNGGAEAAEGYVLALEAAGRAGEAEPIAYKWREAGADNLKAYIDLMAGLLTATPPPRLEQAVVARFAPVVVAQKSAEGAQALGWYAYNTRQLKTADSWFRSAVQWAPEDEPSAYGLAVTSARLNDRATLDSLVRQWGAKSQRILALVSPEARRRLAREAAVTAVAPAPPSAPLRISQSSEPAPPPPTRPVAAGGDALYPVPLESGTDVDAGAGAPAVSGARRSGNCAASSDAAFRSGRLSAEGAVARGWCLLDLDRAMEAVDAFNAGLRLGAGRTAEDAAYGKSLAYLRMGLTNRAQAAAIETSQPPARAQALSADLLAQRALAAYRDARYVETILALDERSRIAPEQQDLMILRAWSYFHLRDFPSAGRIFRALQAAGNPEAGTGINAIMAVTRKWRS